MDSYEVLGVLGEGTYGVVHKAKHRTSGIIVAIKQFKECDVQEQIKKTAIREIRILKQLVHDNIVALFDVFRENSRLFLVFEYVERSLLSDLETCPNGLDKSFVRPLMYQLLQSLAFVHSKNVIHRDIKPENLLLTHNGVLKLCDFGFARAVSGFPGAKYTDYVATRWYRAPELLVGASEYDSGVDTWSVGCLLCELLTGQPLFPGDSDLDQIHHIVSCLGPLPAPLADIFRRNPLYRNAQLPAPTKVDPIARRYPFLSRNTLSLVSACLRYDPAERPSAARLLLHPFFSQGFVEHFSHEFTTVIRRDREVRNRYYSVCGSDSSSAATLHTLSRSIVTDRAAFERSLPGGTFAEHDKHDNPATATPPTASPAPAPAPGREEPQPRRPEADADVERRDRDRADRARDKPRDREDKSPPRVSGELLRLSTQAAAGVPRADTRRVAAQPLQQPMVPLAALTGEQRRLNTVRGAAPAPQQPQQPGPGPGPGSQFSVRSHTQRGGVAVAPVYGYGYPQGLPPGQQPYAAPQQAYAQWPQHAPGAPATGPSPQHQHSHLQQHSPAQLQTQLQPARARQPQPAYPQPGYPAPAQPQPQGVPRLHTVSGMPVAVPVAAHGHPHPLPHAHAHAQAQAQAASSQALAQSFASLQLGPPQGYAQHPHPHPQHVQQHPHAYQPQQYQYQHPQHHPLPPQHQQHQHQPGYPSAPAVAAEGVAGRGNSGGGDASASGDEADQRIVV